MSKTNHILIVDDDPEICGLLQDFLGHQGFRVSTALDGEKMRGVLKKTHVDLIVLDIMLPGEDGLALCRALRNDSTVPIIMLSAAGGETDRVVGLEFGADDYLPKPFSQRELLARIKALLRRSGGCMATTGRSVSRVDMLPSIRFGGWTLDQNKRRLIADDGLAVPLSAAEYTLLLAFVEHPQRTLTRDQLLDITQGRESVPFDRTIDVQVGRLRKKLEDNPKTPKIIITVRGGGYQFASKVECQ